MNVLFKASQVVPSVRKILFDPKRIKVHILHFNDKKGDNDNLEIKTGKVIRIPCRDTIESCIHDFNKLPYESLFHKVEGLYFWENHNLLRIPKVVIGRRER